MHYSNFNTPGDLNTAIGFQGMYSSTIGGYNTALGSLALYANTNGFGNTAIGSTARQNTTGQGNISIGNLAGSSLTTGNNNIMIGNQGTLTDDSTIRIGTYQTSAYMAGILGNTLTNAANVVINANGQLGVQSAPSTRRYKEAIQDMGDASSGLLRLRLI